jgi:CDP-diglyceride synthetase
MYFDWSSNGAKRVTTSAIMILCFALAVLLRFLTVWIFDIVIFAIICVATYEVMRVRKLDLKGISPYYIYPYLTLAFAVYVMSVIAAFPLYLHIILQGVALFIFTTYIYFMNLTDKDFAKQCDLKHLSHGKETVKTAYEFLKLAIYPGLLLFAFVPLNHIETWATITKDGMATEVSLLGLFALLTVICISCFTDTFAYIVGISLKGPKLCPKLSPKKTISGAIGGLFGGVIAPFLLIMCFVQNGSMLQEFFAQRVGDVTETKIIFLAIGFFGSILTQVGDIFASWIKRRNGVKDFATYLPGHGGAMDRLDGISFNAWFVTLAFFAIMFI